MQAQTTTLEPDADAVIEMTPAVIPDELVEDDLVIEEVSYDGICGVY